MSRYCESEFSHETGAKLLYYVVSVNVQIWYSGIDKLSSKYKGQALHDPGPGLDSEGRQGR